MDLLGGGRERLRRAPFDRTPREAEDLLDDTGGAGRRAADLFDVFVRGTVDLGFEDVAVADDRGQEVVEVVSDTTGRTADGFVALTLA